MISVWKFRYVLPVVASFWFVPAFAQQEGARPTQTLLYIDAKAPVTPTPGNITLKVDNKETPLTAVTPVLPAGAQVALLIDDGLRFTAGRELQDMKSFITSLPPGTEIFIGYMQNGRVVSAQNFTTDLAAAAESLHVTSSVPGSSASPYLCLSDFVKKWPSADTEPASLSGATPDRKARFVLMITDGVDPYNGSTSVLNQDSPYVAEAVRDAQRAGVPVYSIYFADAGIHGGQANLSGQSYLGQVANGTGGQAYYQGPGNPVSMTPYFKQFTRAVTETYIASFNTPGRKDLVTTKFSTKLPGTKVYAANGVQPGTRISSSGQ